VRDLISQPLTWCQPAGITSYPRISFTQSDSVRPSVEVPAALFYIDHALRANANSILTRGFQRQIHRERAAAAGNAVDADVAAVNFDDPAHDR